VLQAVALQLVLGEGHKVAGLAYRVPDGVRVGLTSERRGSREGKNRMRNVGNRFMAAGDFDADLVLEMGFSPKLQVKNLLMIIIPREKKFRQKDNGHTSNTYELLVKIFTVVCHENIRCGSGSVRPSKEKCSLKIIAEK
jgi:hypothetical protein